MPNKFYRLVSQGNTRQLKLFYNPDIFNSQLKVVNKHAKDFWLSVPFPCKKDEIDLVFISDEKQGEKILLSMIITLRRGMTLANAIHHLQGAKFLNE